MTRAAQKLVENNRGGDLILSKLEASDLFLVGSISVPSDTAEEAMRVAAAKLGDRVAALPDGEVGPRRWWIAGLGLTTYSKHPLLEQRENADEIRAQLPKMEKAREMADSAGAAQPRVEWTPSDRLLYRRKAGVTRIDLEGYLPYAEAAKESYKIFRKLKEAGDLPADVRFQVSLPPPLAAVYPFFKDPADFPDLMAAWQRAISDEIRKIIEVIPAEELTIQWDYCIEVVDIVGAHSGKRELTRANPTAPKYSPKETFARYTGPDYIRPLSDGVPDKVRFGYHFCLGTYPKFPNAGIDDLSLVVQMANEVVKNTPHRVDFVHLPSIVEADRAFFAPLRDLKVGDAEVFIGVGHRDGRKAIAARARLAREFLPSFGISHYCGYGRDDRDHIEELLTELRGAADILAADRP